jgi:RNA polymerase primary sigma factor
MVVRYLDLRNLSLGGRPFHAVLLCGEAAGDGPVDVAAETFLRTAEPPAHDRWTSTPDLKTQYAPGGKVAIERLINEAKDAIRELVRPASRDLSDGPRALKELFKMGPPAPTAEQVRVVTPRGHVDENGKWDVEATIRVRPDGRAWRMRPVLSFAAETGAGLPVEWERIEPVSSCTIDSDGRLIIAPGVREARFHGVSDPNSHPVPAVESTVTVDIRSVERLDEVPV